MSLSLKTRLLDEKQHRSTLAAAAAAAAASYNSNYYMTFCRCTVGPKFNFPSHCAIFVTF